ncbi:hypothetical protein QFC20_005574 [Naganishia adeliensis]|uniref:Uncharacterized protein n=1 Tax=Naganishia adeliensis TaxID=92952 RepID=A0ACC2VME2_9TREE|nr:hypothetical protein QFC20_005574 [Naganishia adeliensis]
MASRFIILDGGMGTTLEDSGYSVSSKLWSSDPELHEAVQTVHEGFLKAGSDVIGTATYQACESLYLENGFNSEQASKYMRGAVGIAQQAITKAGKAGGSKVGLCLGPFGGTLSPGQEYSGFYPPPYGPKAFDSTGSNTNSFDDATDSEKSVSALRDFHLSRLRVYANEEATWRAVDWVMFETIPLLREGEAIRTAMEDLYRELATRYGAADANDTWWKKPYWTSFVFPEGTSPDASHVSTIVEKMFGGENAETVYPSAIGINCTSPAYIRNLTEQMTNSMAKVLKSASDDSLLLQQPPAFVLYPDGGLVYDVVTRTWHAPKNAPSVDASSDAERSWAKNVAQVARWAAEQEVTTSTGTRPVWRQILVGGCCKSGYKEIAGLRAELL